MKTILIIDDSRFIRTMLRDILSSMDYIVLEAEDGISGIALARERLPDLIIIDIVMPEMDGIDACRILTKGSDTASIPVIILTVRTSTADIKAGLEAGAVDYITKPFGEEELLSRVSSALKLKDFKDQIESLKHRFKELTTTDDLTGLKNASYFWDYLNREIKKTMKKKIPLSLIIIDLDNFKTINDSFGHVIGDEILKEAAHILKEALGKHGFLARYGGEEFVAVLSNTNEEKAFTIAERLRHVLGQKEFSRDNRNFRLSISCGVATMTIDPGHEKEEPIYLFERADKALYEAKTRGKGMTMIARSVPGNTEN